MVIDYLINCGANVNEKNLTGVTPIAKAVESGRPNALNTVQCLLKHRADTSIFTYIVRTLKHLLDIPHISLMYTEIRP